jgi:dTDP-4-dehydrorhamnose reductase
MIGITNRSGRLGKILDTFGYHLVDLSNAHEFNVIIHNGAYTDVDGAEECPEFAVRTNSIFTEDLRMATDAKIVYLSTDFVFDGADGPYNELDVPAPISVYGGTKLMGEAVLKESDVIVRTTVLYGGHRPDFVTWVLDKLKTDAKFSVSSRMITSPTNVYHLAEALKFIIENDLQKHIINIAGDTVISRYAFARYIAETFGFSPEKVGYTTQTNFGAAKRPERAGLKTELAISLGIPIYSVFDGLKRMKNER